MSTPCKITTYTPYRVPRSKRLTTTFTEEQSTLIIANCRKHGITFGIAFPFWGSWVGLASSTESASAVESKRTNGNGAVSSRATLWDLSTVDRTSIRIGTLTVVRRSWPSGSAISSTPILSCPLSLTNGSPTIDMSQRMTPRRSLPYYHKADSFCGQILSKDSSRNFSHPPFFSK